MEQGYNDNNLYSFKESDHFLETCAQCAQICIKIEGNDDRTDRHFTDVPTLFIVGTPTSNARRYKTN